ncbi:carbohydrate ABC transporter permease [Halalkalibacter kiskunsagensis]|uniref:Carbohydrate ABC transporter permease n=1 Tax=Halalkalibacter kiskunsagensis TaxID=1548599 RepID=A0ABV6K728_9BACI
MNTNLKIKKIWTYSFLIIAGLVFAAPFVWMISTSLKPNSQMFSYPPEWVPEYLYFEHYIKAVTDIQFFTFFQNSLIIACLSTLGVMISCPLAGYAFARLQWKGRDTLFIVTLAVMMIPFPVTMVPLFVMFSKINLVNTFLPMIIPTFFGVPFFIFLMRQFFKQLPKSLEDAARIDGCSELMIYLRIMLPLCQPAILTIGLFQFMASWNDFLQPLIYLNDESLYTLQLGLQQFRSAQDTAWGPMMAASVLIALPIITIYFFVQKAFIKGISFGGVKG